jgi:hypothetical protein
MNSCSLFLFHAINRHFVAVSSSFPSQLTLPTIPVGAAITSLSSSSVFFLRIVDRSAAGPAFAARHPCARFRLYSSSSSPHLPPLFCRFYSSKKKKSSKMPPKKAQVQEKVLLGRPGNNLKSGIVCEQRPHPLFFSPCGRFFFSHSTVHFLIPRKTI